MLRQIRWGVIGPFCGDKIEGCVLASNQHKLEYLLGGKRLGMLSLG